MANRMFGCAVAIGIAATVVGFAPAGAAVPKDLETQINTCADDSKDYDSFMACMKKLGQKEGSGQQQGQEDESQNGQQGGGNNPLCAGTPLASTPMCAQPD